jgi:hypothetical protein
MNTPEAPALASISVSDTPRRHHHTPHPLFEDMLRQSGLTLRAPYTCSDIALLFGVTARTIQGKVADGTLPSRKLIGGGRFLAADLEEYLQNARQPAPSALR